MLNAHTKLGASMTITQRRAAELAIELLQAAMAADDGKPHDEQKMLYTAVTDTDNGEIRRAMIDLFVDGNATEYAQIRLIID